MKKLLLAAVLAGQTERPHSTLHGTQHQHSRST